MNLDNVTLLELLADLESDRVERKATRKADAPKKLRQAIFYIQAKHASFD